MRKFLKSLRFPIFLLFQAVYSSYRFSFFFMIFGAIPAAAFLHQGAFYWLPQASGFTL
ncbi:MAG: hypothetical protein O8C62_05205 [Candidatus Methanoperedens sp.]|nr:hypothetical protein [Candidatus Methanoperedens sp.]